MFTRSPADDELKLDVRNPDTFESLPRGIPVVNTAGLPDQNSPVSLMRQVHVDGMQNLTGWARRTGCPHIVHLSSIAVYGNATVGIGRTEAATRRRKWNPLVASLPYGRTKARAEALLERSGVPWSALRLPAVFGPGDSFFTRQLRRLILDEGRPLPPGNTRPVSIMPVTQVGPLIERILEAGPLKAALNAAGAHVPWLEILESYSEEWACPLTFASRHRIRDYLKFNDPGTQMAAFYARWGAEFPDAELRRRLGWIPEIDWRETVRQAAGASVPQHQNVI